MTTAKLGLEDVILTRQDIGYLDGAAGKLVYRGYSIDALAPAASYEEVVYLLWYGRLPNRQELNSFLAQLAAQRALSDDHHKLIELLPKNAQPMAVCRTGVSQLGLFDAEKPRFERDQVLPKAVNILAKMPTLMAAFARHRKNLAPVPPRTDLSHAANFLWMLTGQPPAPEAEAALNLYFVLLADLELNASTFAARVTAATWADIYAAVVSSISALSGHAHGGALQEVMGQFQEIDSVENVEAWFNDRMQNKRRLMGIGHRVFKVLDPRVPHLKAKIEALAETKTEKRRWFDIASRLEAVTGEHPFFQARKLYPNVDYYAAPLLYMLGLAPDMFTTIFASSRIAGWAAHIMHQYENNRLIRPRAEYTGPTGLRWTPIDQR